MTPLHQVTAEQARTGKYPCPHCKTEHVYDQPKPLVVNAAGVIERTCLITGLEYELQIVQAQS